MRDLWGWLPIFVLSTSMAAADEAAWVVIPSPDGKFSVEFPDKPQTVTENNGDPTKMQGFAWQANQGQSGLFLVTQPYSAKSPRAFLQGVVAGDAEKGEISEPSYFEHQGREAVDYRCTKKNPEGAAQYWRKRFIIDHDRVYMLQSLSLGKPADAAEVDRFFASFKLAQPAKTKPEPVLIGKQQAFRYPPLGLSFPLPEGWYVTESIAGDLRPLLAQAATAKENRKLTLLIANSKKEFSPSEASSLGLNLVIPAKKPTTVDEYQREMIDSLAGGRFAVRTIREPALVKVNEREFSRSDISLTLGDITVYQRQFHSFERNAILSFVLVAPTEKELDLLDELLSGAKFTSAAETSPR